MLDQSRLLTFSCRLYTLLLLAYPTRFRRAYSREMAQVFRDDIRGTFRESGAAGLMGLWVLVVLDLLKTAFAEHIWEVFHMPMEKLMRFSGPAAMLAGAFWTRFWWMADFDQGSGTATTLGIALSLTVLLSAFALSGTFARLSNRTPAVVTLLVAIAGLGLFGVLGLVILFTDSGNSLVWLLFMAGYWLLLVGFATMGSVALTSGASKIVAYSLLALALFSVVIWISGSENREIQLAGVIGLGVSWVALGFGLWTSTKDVPGPALPA